jgi:hypothetical protein
MLLEIAQYFEGILIEVHKLSTINKRVKRLILRRINSMDLTD